MELKSTIRIAAPSSKHVKYVSKAIEYLKGNSPTAIHIAEGAIRSGKTIDHCFLAAAYLEVCEDRLHLASGSSIHNAKLNIGDCNGFGLEFLFRGRSRWGKHRDNEALFIQTQTGEKIVIFAGGGKADSYKGILGNSYGLWIATEINEHYDSDDSRTSFIMVAQGRQIAAQKSFTLWDLNPCHPRHVIYEKYIDKYASEGIANHEAFTLYDNSSLTPEKIKNIERRYVPGTVWHQRDILGKRCIADGLIFKHFADRRAEYLIETKDLPDLAYILIGVDPGGSKSAHSFTATGLTADFGQLIALRSEKHNAKDTDADYVSRLFNDFVEKVEHKYGRVLTGYCDSEAQTIKNTLTNKGAIQLQNSVKNKIKDRIDCLAMLIAQKRFFYTEDCESLCESLCEQVWDPKHPDERLDDGTVDIHSADSFEYSWEAYIRYLLQ